MQDTKAGRFRIGSERFLTGGVEGFNDLKMIANRKTTHKEDRRKANRRSTDKRARQQQS